MHHLSQEYWIIKLMTEYHCVIHLKWYKMLRRFPYSIQYDNKIQRTDDHIRPNNNDLNLFRIWQVVIKPITYQNIRRNNSSSFYNFFGQYLLYHQTTKSFTWSRNNKNEGQYKKVVLNFCFNTAIRLFRQYTS